MCKFSDGNPQTAKVIEMPQPSEQPHNSDKHFYDRISSAYDSIADANEHAARETGETMLNVQPGERVLEIGFGTGNSILNLAKAVGAEGKVSGIDVSQGMLDVAQKKVDDAGLSDVVSLLLGDAVSLPWEDDEFDAVFMSFTLELFSEEDLPKVLAECKRVLKPGGRIASVSMATVNEGDPESFLEKTYKWFHRHFPHIVDCRPINLKSVLEKAGFAIVEEKRMEIWTMPVSATLAKTP
jgi:demethylmenaquinone methyltransferase/2-methoxy-6-polyprenyl-1,4-benzoquinol methylase